MEDRGLVGGYVGVSGEGGVAGVEGVRVLQLPLPPRPLQPLPAPLPLHVRPAGVVDQSKLQESTENKSLTGSGPHVDSLGVRHRRKLG